MKHIRSDQSIRKGMDGAAAFTVTLLNASTVAHLYHLKSTSYAQHMALGALYEGLPGLVDGFVEAYQGKYGLIEGYPSSTVECGDTPVPFVESLIGFVEQARMSLPQDTELMNIVDEIAALINSTAYKLKFLA